MLRELERQYYERQLLLENFSVEQQEKLKKAKVLVICAGGLGCPALIYLATAGIGEIGIVDYDKVSTSNLHRQILYDFRDIGKAKAEIAAKKLMKINPAIHVKAYNYKIKKDNINSLISEYHVILDCPDNYETRYIVERAATEQKKTIIFGSVFCYEGQMATFRPDTACYHCAFPINFEEKGEDITLSKGIYPPITAIIGAMQASETIKEILGINKHQPNILWTINLLNNMVREYHIEKNIECPVCGGKE